jgi:hypothetical protein
MTQSLAVLKPTSRLCALFNDAVSYLCYIKSVTTVQIVAFM